MRPSTEARAAMSLWVIVFFGAMALLTVLLWSFGASVPGTGD